jgi:hypothetical protein
MIRAFSERYLHDMSNESLLTVIGDVPIIVTVNLDPVVDVHRLVRHRLEVREPHCLRRSVLGLVWALDDQRTLFAYRKFRVFELARSNSIRGSGSGRLSMGGGRLAMPRLSASRTRPALYHASVESVAAPRAIASTVCASMIASR